MTDPPRGWPVDRGDLVTEDNRIPEIRAVLDNWNLGNITDDALIALDEIRKIVGPTIIHTDPEFVDMRTDSDCLRACLATVTGRPWDEAPDNVGDWRRKAVDFLTSHPRSEWVIGIGESPRGCKGGHAIVCTPDGRLVHDPHPSRDGVVAMWELWDEHGEIAVDQVDFAHRATSERAIPEPTEGGAT